jgi:hypothetical protein
VVCALVKEVIEGAVRVAAVALIQLLGDILAEAAGVGGRERVSNHKLQRSRCGMTGWGGQVLVGSCPPHGVIFPVRWIGYGVLVHEGVLKPPFPAGLDPFSRPSREHLFAR